ncbi:MAG: hypothetical protein ABW360_09080 [Phenylobacterium sp.]
MAGTHNTILVMAVVAMALCIDPAGAADQAPLIREERVVSVDGRAESWRLVWAARPAAACQAAEIDIAVTCPCSGFAYGETGDLLLERRRPGGRTERLRLAPLFDRYLDLPLRGAVLASRPMEANDFDRAEGGDATLPQEIAARSAGEVMRLADYDHDGAATEFLIQVGTMPCGKRMFAAVGVSKASPHLHALGSAAHPDRPLIMVLSAWQALAESDRPAPLVYWPCGDHGSEVESQIAVSASEGRIRAVNRDFSCPGGASLGRPVTTTEW